MCKFKLKDTVYDRSNHFGIGEVIHINNIKKWIEVKFDDDNNQQYTTSGRRIAQEATLQTKEDAFPFKVGDIVEDTTRKFGKGIVTEVDPDYVAIAVTVKFDNNPTPQAYTADGRFYTNEPVTLELVERPFTFEVGDYVVDSNSVEYGIGRVHSLLNTTPYNVRVEFPSIDSPNRYCNYTTDGRYYEEEEPVLILIRRNK